MAIPYGGRSSESGEGEPPEVVDAWLNGTTGTELLQPAAVDAQSEWPVSRRVNRSGQGDDDPMLIQPETG
ncbi:MAG: hypothetical protein WB524_19915 [Acidobacteriaceae bacterium]